MHRREAGLVLHTNVLNANVWMERNVCYGKVLDTSMLVIMLCSFNERIE